MCTFKCCGTFCAGLSIFCGLALVCLMSNEHIVTFFILIIFNYFFFIFAFTRTTTPPKEHPRAYCFKTSTNLPCIQHSISPISTHTHHSTHHTPHSNETTPIPTNDKIIVPPQSSTKKNKKNMHNQIVDHRDFLSNGVPLHSHPTRCKWPRGLLWGELSLFYRCCNLPCYSWFIHWLYLC